MSSRDLVGVPLLGPVSPGPGTGADEVRRGVLDRSLVALVLLTGAGAAAAAALATDGSARLVASVVAFTLYLLLLLFLTGAGHRQAGLVDFRIGSWMLAFAALAYGVATLGLFLPRTEEELRADPAGAPYALATLALGFTVFAVATSAGPTALFARGTRLLLGGRDLDRACVPGRPARIVAGYGAGVATTALLISLTGGFGYLGRSVTTGGADLGGSVQLLTLLTFLRTAALYAAAHGWAARRGRAYGPLTAVLLLAEVLAGLLFATKESFVVAVLAVLIPFVQVRRRSLPWRQGLAGLAVFVLVVTPFVTALRGEVRTGTQVLGVEQSLRVGVATLLDPTDPQVARYREQAVRQVAARVRLVDNQVVIITKTPTPYDYKPTSELLTLPLAGLVPRAVWPDKPVRLSGFEFYRVYFQGEGVSSSALTYQGSLYLYGGLVPMLLGMLLLGSLVRGIDDTAAAAGPLRGGLMALVVFVPLVKQELEATTLLASLPIWVLTYLAARWALLVRDRSGREPFPTAA